MDDWDDSPTVPENPGTKSSNSGNRNNDGRNNSWSGNRNNDGRNTSWSGNSYNDSAKNSWSGNSHNDGGGNWGGGRGSRGRGGRGRYDNQRPREPNDGSRVFTNSRSKFNQNQEEQTDSINIPQSLIGKFIGRGGSHINGLKDKYQVKLNIESGDSEPYLALSGPQELLKVAKKEISELIEEWIKQDESGDRRGSNRQDDGGSSYNNRENSWQNRGGNQRNEGGGHWEDRKENNQGSRGNNWEDNRTNNGGYNSQSQTTSESTTDTNSKEEVKIVDFAALNKQCDEMEAAYWAQFPPLVKTFYKELDEVKNWNMEEVEQFRLENFKIKVNRPMDPDCQTPIPKPVRTFYEAFHQYPEILETIKKVGFKNPTPIQCQAWPIIMSGEDVIGIAQTGTGKTLAFLLPAFLHIDGQTIPRNKRVGPTALVLAPTRELAVQIDKEVKKYEYKGIKSITIYGGASRSDQISKLKEGVELIIATPGRLDDLMMAGHVKVESFSYIVLDEADRMLDMGFEPQIRKIMYRVNPKRQTIMTSATWPSGVRRLCKSYTEHPVQICVGSLDLAAVDTVTQEIHFVEPDDKFDYLVDFLRNLDDDAKVIIFVGKKVLATFLTSEFAIMRLDCTSIHGNLEQGDREQAIEDMIDGTCKILIATDVASRGIDIANITHVVNYDFPRDCEEYVHRVGRTGRAGKKGTAISYFTYSDRSQAKELISILESTNQEVPHELVRLCSKHEAQLASGKGRPRRGRY